MPKDCLTYLTYVASSENYSRLLDFLQLRHGDPDCTPTGLIEACLYENSQVDDEGNKHGQKM